MDFSQAIKQRHSVRSYDDKPVEAHKREILNEMIAKINAQANLNIQIFYDEPKCFDSFMAHYGKFSGVKNYICLVGKKSKTLDEALGYFGEQLVLKAQEMGLNTCWVAMSHGKSKAEIQKGEKQICLIALGYGSTQGKAHKSKPLSEVCSFKEPAPDWFKSGMQAALLAPTAMNQQKFFFELCADGSVCAKCGKGFYTKLDLGIVKYHFYMGSGKKVFSENEYIKD